MKIYYSNPNRKKIRGWKRRIKQIDKWGDQVRHPQIDYFLHEKVSHIYRRCNLSPFYKLTKLQPPLWFYKLIITYFTIAYVEWEKVFKDMGIPFDLQLWIYDPAYIRSEIVCYRMEQKGQRMQFAWESNLKKSFPYQKFKGANDNS